jgi:hypothetical protein
MDKLINDILENLYQKTPKKFDDNRIIADTEKKAFCYNDILVAIMECSEKE